uniref:Histidine-rich glycoprotein-like n=1 Tax=Cucumis melo TaxID=3656 RepID=A0A9I9D6P2_CUCME
MRGRVALLLSSWIGRGEAVPSSSYWRGRELYHHPFGEVEAKLHRCLCLGKREVELHHHRHLGDTKAECTIVSILETWRQSCTIIIILERVEVELHLHCHLRGVEEELHHHHHLGDAEVKLHHRHPLEVAPSSFGELKVDMYYHHHARSCNTLEMNNPLDG